MKEDTEAENGDDQVERQKRQIEDKRQESYKQRLKKKLRVFAFRSRHLGGMGL